MDARTQVDIMHQALFRVQREHEKSKWDRVAQGMAALGASRRFTGASCEKRFLKTREGVDV